MAYQTILLEAEGPLARLTFNRPDRLNALDEQMMAELDEALTAVAAAPTRVLLVTGTGRAFMAGADIRQFLEFDSRRAYDFISRGQRLLQRLADLPIPVLAAVNGFALGGGLELALACDLVYAAAEASFGLPEVNLGIMPGLGGTQRLARLLGPARAKELCLTGRIFTAAEAKDLGLVSQIWSRAELLPAVDRIARELAAKSRRSLALIKKTIERGAAADLPQGLQLEAQAFALCFAGPDPKEGAQAFLAKRPPQFVD